MAAHFSKYYSNSGKKNVFAKTLISEGIFGVNGRTYTINSKTMKENAPKFADTDIVYTHQEPPIKVGRMLEVFCNGSDGLIDRNGDIYDKVGWTAIYELDENKLKNCGLSLEEAGKLDLSTSYTAVMSNQADLYNGAKIDGEVIGLRVRNVALVQRGRYNETRGIINNGEGQEFINLIFTSNDNTDKNDISSMDENKTPNIQQNMDVSSQNVSNGFENDEDKKPEVKEGGSEANEANNKEQENKVEEKNEDKPNEAKDNEGKPNQSNVDLASLADGISKLTEIAVQFKKFADVMQGKAPVEEQPVEQPMEAQPAEKPVEEQQAEPADASETQKVEAECQQNEQQDGQASNVPQEQQMSLVEQWKKEHQMAVRIMQDNLTPETYNQLLSALVNGDNASNDMNLQNELETTQEQVYFTKNGDKLDNKKNDFYKLFSF